MENRKYFRFPCQCFGEVRIDIPEKKSPLLITGKVKWSNPIINHIEVGIQFTDLDPLTKRDLLDYGFSTWCNEVRYKQADGSLHN